MVSRAVPPMTCNVHNIDYDVKDGCKLCAAPATRDSLLPPTEVKIIDSRGAPLKDEPKKPNVNALGAEYLESTIPDCPLCLTPYSEIKKTGHRGVGTTQHPQPCPLAGGNGVTTPASEPNFAPYLEMTDDRPVERRLLAEIIRFMTESGPSGRS